jgi:hypothetical protein
LAWSRSASVSVLRFVIGFGSALIGGRLTS